VPTIKISRGFTGFDFSAGQPFYTDKMLLIAVISQCVHFRIKQMFIARIYIKREIKINVSLLVRNKILEIVVQLRTFSSGFCV